MPALCLLAGCEGGHKPALAVVTHETAAGQVENALRAIRELPASLGSAIAMPVVSDRGVEGLGWT